MNRYIAFALLALCSAPGCGGGSGTGDNGDVAPGFDRAPLLANLADVILVNLQEFEMRAADVERSTAAYADAVGTADAAARLGEAQDAWRSAMQTWQQAEVFAVGPAGATGVAIGGQDLRDEIYSWPTVNTCRVDQELVEARYGASDFFTTELVNVYGLDALEYLLFNAQAANTCAPQVDINASGSWDGLDEAQRTRRRADYARAVGAHVAREARRLADLWSPSGGNFVAELTGAGATSQTYPTAQSALDALFGAMFYVELRTKDLKLGAPVGIGTDCPSTVCPDRLESRWAMHSKANVVANLRGFEKLLLGGAPADADRSGFDDLLRAVGAVSVADALAADTALAISAVEAIDGSMAEALASEPASVRSAHEALKIVMDRFKQQFVTELKLKIPDEGAADND